MPQWSVWDLMGRTDEFNRGHAECDYCGGRGHTYEVHPEAVRDVQQWEREKTKEESPFGDYRGT